MYLLPKLKQALLNKWLEPSTFKTQEEFFKAYTEAHGRAKAYKEIIDLIENSEARIASIKKALDAPNKTYGI